MKKPNLRGIQLERWTREGESPVLEKIWTSVRYPSKSGHVKPGPNLGGQSPKAKYSLATDSKSVARAKDEKNPARGGKDPETVCLQAVGARKGDGVPIE